MALKKQIELKSGVVTNYHRVVSVNTITNLQNTIEIASYTSEAKREEELETILAGGIIDVFVSTRYVCAPYDQAMTVEGAYEWVVGNVPEFAGAERA